MAKVEEALINAVCEKKDASILYSGIDDLLGDYSDMWTALKSYHTKYRSLPDVSLLQEKFPDLEKVEVKGDTRYYVDELRNHFIRTQFQQVMLKAAGDLKTDSPARVLEKAYSEMTKLGRLSNTARDLDLTDVAAAERHIVALHERSREMGGTPGIKTGLKSIDLNYPTGIAPGHMVVAIGWPSRGKSGILDSIVYDKNGPKRFGDLKVGDRVMGKAGREVTVTGVFPQGVTKNYRVKTNDGSATVVSSEHLWSIITPKMRQKGKTDQYRVMTTEEIIEYGLFRPRGDHKEYRAFLPINDPVAFDKVEVPIAPYTMGAMIANGAMGGASTRVATNDQWVIDRLSEENTVTEHTYENSTVRQTCVLGAVTILKKYGWWGVKSRQKYIPKEYLYNDIDSRLELLRGLMDGDGSSTPSGADRGRATYCTTSEQLAKDVCELVRSLGGVARIREDLRGCFNLTIWTPFNPFGLPRKADKYKSVPWFRAIESIEPVEDAETMCISVDAEDSLYLTDDFIVTHNTWFCSYLACKAWEQGFHPMIVSLEMSPENMRDRIYTMMASGLFRASDFARGDISLDNFRAWGNKVMSDKPPFTIVSTDGMTEMTPAMVEGKIEQHRPDLVIADYHQLFTNNGRSNSPIERAMNISREFKRLAVSREVGLIDITAATSDDTSDRDSPPMMSQVAWSKAIEYDADMAFAVHRESDTNLINIVGRKNRFGDLFDFYMEVDLDRGKWEEKF